MKYVLQIYPNYKKESKKMMNEIQAYREKEPTTNYLYMNCMAYKPSAPIMSILVFKTMLE